MQEQFGRTLPPVVRWIFGTDPADPYVAAFGIRPGPTKAPPDWAVSAWAPPARADPHA